MRLLKKMIFEYYYQITKKISRLFRQSNLFLQIHIGNLLATLHTGKFQGLSHGHIILLKKILTKK